MLTNESIAVLEFISSYYLSGPQNHQYNQEKNSPHRFFSFLFFPIFSTISTLFFSIKKKEASCAASKQHCLSNGNRV